MEIHGTAETAIGDSGYKERAKGMDKGIKITSRFELDLFAPRKNKGERDGGAFVLQNILYLIIREKLRPLRWLGRARIARLMLPYKRGQPFCLAVENGCPAQRRSTREE
ncbi:hypothetical protein YDYSY3_58900 [Paenibacillus chitinolyticus]|nr:hypothetical protein YDYSY3_58900 [Paenibacillus chitinolyticus]